MVSHASARAKGRSSLAVVPIDARESGGEQRKRVSRKRTTGLARSNESTEADLFHLVVSARLNLLLLLRWSLLLGIGWS